MQLSGSGLCSVSKGPGGTVVHVPQPRVQAGEDFPWDAIPFGYRIIGGDENNLWIRGGYIEHRDQHYEVAARTLTLTGGTQFIAVRYLWNQSAAILDPVSSRNECKSNDTSFKKALWQFSYNATTGKIKREAIEWMGGNISLGPSF